MRRIEQKKLIALEVRSREAIGDDEHLFVGGVLPRKQPPRELQSVLDVRKVRRDLHLRDPRIAHVGPEPHDRIKDCDRLREERRDLAKRP